MDDLTQRILAQDAEFAQHLERYTVTLHCPYCGHDRTATYPRGEGIMAGWVHKVKVKHLFTGDEDFASISASMNAIADVLATDRFFTGFNVQALRTIPQGDAVFGPVDYANKLLGRMYDYADSRRIWVE